MPSTPEQLTHALIRNFSARKPLRAGSLIVSIFGDCIVPRGGVVWLGSLIEVLKPLGISDRLVRTAVYRLTQDDILTNEQIGRRSYYTLTESGRNQFDEATARIYAQPDSGWDNSWCLLLLSALPTKQRSAVRRDLSWLGFGQFGNDLLAHPSPDRARMLRHLDRLGVRSQVVVLDATLSSVVSELNLQQLVVDTWDLDAIEQKYTQYVESFHPLLSALSKKNSLQQRDAFYIRTFMIQEYRKVLLRDPALPRALLPTTWKGHTAYQLSRELYRKVVAASERFIDNAFENQIGPLPTAAGEFTSRFGGLADVMQNSARG